MTENILRSIKFRDKLYKQYLSKPLHSTEKNLRVFNKILKKDIREPKKSYYYNELKKYKRDIKRPGTQLRAYLTNRNKTMWLLNK